jgi:hypothetical protein
MPLHFTAVAKLSGVGGGQGIIRWNMANGSGTAPTVTMANAALAAANELMGAYTTYAPVAVSWSWDNVLQVYDDATGALTGAVVATSSPEVGGGSGTGEFTSGTGARVNWSTSTVRRGRFVHGSTYIIPMVSSVFTSAGNIASGPQSAIEAAAALYYAAAYDASLIPVVYSRPSLADVHYPVTPGESTPIEGWTVSTTPAFLRRRRN